MEGHTKDLEVTRDLITDDLPKFYTQNLYSQLFPPNYGLLPATNQIYELELALGEFASLSSQDLKKRGAYFWKVDGEETYHYKMCAVSPVQVDKDASARRKTFFEANLFKTGYATHGLFPYRGKFHPQLIKALMNIIGLQKGDTVLDPMVGSGTTCVEAALMNITSIGIEKSPFCCLMTKAKLFGLKLDSKELKSYSKNTSKIFNYFDAKKNSMSLLEFMGEKKKVEKSSNGFGNYEELFKLSYLDAMGYARRRKQKTSRELFPVIFDRYLQAILNFVRVRDELELKIGKAKILEGDARDLKELGIKDESIDGIITSPPYSFAIDYLANDFPQLEYMKVDTAKLKEEMIGLRGRYSEEVVSNYFEDMDRVMSEMSRVLKPNKSSIIVVGTNTNQLRRMLGNNGDDIRIDKKLIEIGKDHGLDFKKHIIRPIEGIRNMLRDEYVLCFVKR